MIFVVIIHTEVDLNNVFDVAVTVTEATSAVTWKQCVKHVEKRPLSKSLSFLTYVVHKQGLPSPLTLVQRTVSPRLGSCTNWVGMAATEQETEPKSTRAKHQTYYSDISIKWQIIGHGSGHRSSCFLDVSNNTEKVVSAGKAPENDNETPDLHC